MTIILELTPSQENAIKRQAALRGVDVNSYLLELATTGQNSPDAVNAEDFDMLLDRLAKPGLGLPDDALTSEVIYRDHA